MVTIFIKEEIKISKFTNSLTIEKFSTEKGFSGKNWPVAFYCGEDYGSNISYAVVIDKIRVSELDDTFASDYARLFAKSVNMYWLLKRYGDELEPGLSELIKNILDYIEGNEENM